MATPEPERASAEANVEDAPVAVTEEDAPTDATDGAAANANANAHARERMKKPPTAMSPEQKRALVEQLEFYFSDANIVTDAWLRPRVERGEGGFVALRDICAFR